MGITGNEVSAVNEQRRNEDLGRSRVGDVLSAGASATGTAIAFGTSLVASGPAGLVVAGSVVAGMGIVDWFRKHGTGKVEENLEALGQATEDAFNRVERVLAEQGKSIEEIQRRFESDDLKQAIASASLQALRTSNERRLRRLALILANGVKEKDLAPESTDDMMRAAIELKDVDIALLGKLYASQNRPLLLQVRKGQSPDNWHGNIQTVWREFIESGALNREEHLSYRSSFSRLESAGLVQHVNDAGMYGVGFDPYALLLEGKRFYERLQEIGMER